MGHTLVIYRLCTGNTRKLGQRAAQLAKSFRG